jgi:class 3 adenylate cyclase/tetratricopeptide (TPR) repeat protein
MMPQPSYPWTVLTCPRCGEGNPERARFCLNCGEPLSEPTQRRRERKYATALFADLVGSTSLAEREDPEIVQSVVGRTFDRLADEIGRYEGLLEKFMGDAVLAVFGVPRAHEDDAERAVRAALEMQAVLSELNRSFAAEGKPELAMRIGVEAGEVLVDVERASGPRDRMLTGDAVNTAARLQTAADPGRVLVGPGVFAATKDVIEYGELPALDLKGKEQQVPAWQALRIRAKQRGERPELGMEAKLVGRDEELSVLKETFRRVEGESRPALVTVVGPAGVGKSRLVRELERYVEGLPEFVYWRRGRCLAYGNASYSALADAIKAQCEILEDDATDVVLKKVEGTVRELFGDGELVPQIGALVGAGEPGSLGREDLFDAWRRFLERLSARYPLVLAFEDIHWADDGLLDFIEHIADWAQGPIMTVALARPELFEARPTWGGGKRNAASIYVDPLSPGESSVMLDDLLTGALTEELVGTIVELSEGNPLYVEELVRKLIDDGVLRATEAARWEVARSVTELELPRSIQALIAARLDGLPNDEKAFLQDAAVVGRVFWVGAVAALSGGSVPEVRDALGRLRVKELVLPNDPPSFSDEHEFTFRHVLIRDGAYDSLPKALRAEKHEQVARWAEARAGDRAEEMAELIATHEVEALRYLDELGTMSGREAVQRAAYRWSRAAGDRAAGLWLAAEAVRWYGEALRIADDLGLPAADRAARARDLGLAMFGSTPSPETERIYRRAVSLFEEAGDERGAGWAESWLVLPLFQQGRDDEALASGRSAVARLEPFGDTPELADAFRLLGQFHWRRGHSEEADENLRRAIAVTDRVEAPVVRAAAMQDLGILQAQTGHSAEALATLEEAFELAKVAVDRVNLMRIHNNLASTLVSSGSDYRRAREIGLAGLELAQKAGGGWAGWILGTLGDISFALGDLDDAEARIRSSLEYAEAGGDEPLQGQRIAALAQVELARGDTAAATASMRRADDILEGLPEPQIDIYREEIRAGLALASGRDDDALVHLRLGVTYAEDYAVDGDPQVVLELVRFLIPRGGGEEAERARRLLHEGDAPLTRACAPVADGLLASDPTEAVALFRDGAGRLEALGTRVDQARALLDLGRAERRAGDDPRRSFERARELLVDCGALLHLREADAELAG